MQRTVQMRKGALLRNLCGPMEEKEDKQTVQDKGETQNWSHLISLSEPETRRFFYRCSKWLEFQYSQGTILPSHAPVSAACWLKPSMRKPHLCRARGRRGTLHPPFQHKGLLEIHYLEGTFPTHLWLVSVYTPIADGGLANLFVS